MPVLTRSHDHSLSQVDSTSLDAEEDTAPRGSGKRALQAAFPREARWV